MTSLLAEKPAVREAPPRFRSVPDSAGSTGDEAVELAQLAGLSLDHWQADVLRGALGEKPDGTWAAPFVGLVVPRQNGKGAILEARELAGLFLLREKLIIHSAHQFDTSLEAFRRLLFLIENTPELDSRVKRVSRSHGEEGIELMDGSRIRFRTRTSGGGRGFSAPCVILDEAMILPEATHAALLPLLSAQANPQVWYTGSAVDQASMEHGIVLARVRERGLRADGGVCYFEWSVPEERIKENPATIEDPETWSLANPGQGIRISPDTIDNERLTLSPRAFLVERLGVGDWPRTDGETGRIIPFALWRSCASDETSSADPIFAIDASPDHAWASIAAATPGEVPTIEIVEHHKGVAWVVESAKRLAGKAPFIIDPRGPAASLIPDLEDVGVELIEVSTQDYVRACAQFVDAVTERTVRYPPPQPELDEAVGGATTRSLGEAWAWSRKSAAVDISPLVAATLALWGAASAPAAPQVWDLNEIVERMRAEGRL